MSPVAFGGGGVTVPDMVEHEVGVGKLGVGRGRGLALIAGPCVIESRDHTLRLAELIRTACDRLSLPLVFKASFDKANRSSGKSFRGPGLEKGLKILAEVRERLFKIHPNDSKLRGRIMSNIVNSDLLERSNGLPRDEVMREMVKWI